MVGSLELLEPGSLGLEHLGEVELLELAVDDLHRHVIGPQSLECADEHQHEDSEGRGQAKQQLVACPPATSHPRTSLSGARPSLGQRIDDPECLGGNLPEGRQEMETNSRHCAVEGW